MASEHTIERQDPLQRLDINEQWAHSGIIVIGEMAFVGYCVGNIGQSVEMQIHGALDHLESRLSLIGLKLDHVVSLDCLFRDIWQIPVMEQVFKERFKRRYPVRKSIQTAFAHPDGEKGESIMHFQCDAIVYKGI